MFVMQAAFRSSPDDEEALRAIDLLYDAALVSSGFTVSIAIISMYNLKNFNGKRLFY